MLLEVHVRNLALIERADLEFYKGLTILTGETGAGKSILIDSINYALGSKSGKDCIRTGAEYAYVELVFAVDDKDRIEEIKNLDIEPTEDGLLIISRKITTTRSIIKINDRTVTLPVMKKLTELLIDIHGQHEHQSLLQAGSHLKFIDKMSPDGNKKLKKELYDLYSEYQSIEEKLKDGTDASVRSREMEILRYEIDEIEKADIKEGEEEKLLEEFRRIKNSAKISDLLSSSLKELDPDMIERSLRDAMEAGQYDAKLQAFADSLSQVDDIMTGTMRDMKNYLQDMSYDEEEFDKIEKRLDVIHTVQGKYSDDLGTIKKIYEEKKTRLLELEHFDENHDEMVKRRDKLSAAIDSLCDKLSTIRKKTATKLTTEIIKQLEDLNFLGVEFKIDFKKSDKPNSTGYDQVEFLISTNPGEDIRPLKDIASGGELSRVMLALKTVLADTDEIETLIFDEIDAGISGITAQKVAEKLSIIGATHQVICITHLPQIAAMADYHYLISKKVEKDRTKTDIRYIEGEDIVKELARLIGGSKITKAVMDAASEMKSLANKAK